MRADARVASGSAQTEVELDGLRCDAMRFAIVAAAVGAIGRASACAGPHWAVALLTPTRAGLHGPALGRASFGASVEGLP